MPLSKKKWAGLALAATSLIIGLVFSTSTDSPPPRPRPALSPRR
ncbi:hypothetical protein ACN28S_55550 [Cystobacter fuscus]